MREGKGVQTRRLDPTTSWGSHSLDFLFLRRPQPRFHAKKPPGGRSGFFAYNCSHLSARFFFRMLYTFFTLLGAGLK